MTGNFVIEPRYLTIADTEYTINGYSVHKDGNKLAIATYKDHNNNDSPVTNKSTRKSLFEIVEGKKKKFKHKRDNRKNKKPIKLK
jgi:hypothetical protein